VPSLLPILADAPNPSASSNYMPSVRVEIAFNAGVQDRLVAVHVDRRQ
jgi:hypothetical protein